MLKEKSGYISMIKPCEIIKTYTSSEKDLNISLEDINKSDTGIWKENDHNGL
jgi:hypothetical protein